MSAGQHTRGPWRVAREAQEPTYEGCRDIMDDGGCIATTHGLEDDAEDAANARLIAAAPRLLEACRSAIVALKGREHDGFLRDAIEQATGVRP